MNTIVTCFVAPSRRRFECRMEQQYNRNVRNKGRSGMPNAVAGTCYNAVEYAPDGSE